MNKYFFKQQKSMIVPKHKPENRCFVCLSYVVLAILFDQTLSLSYSPTFIDKVKKHASVTAIS